MCEGSSAYPLHLKLLIAVLRIVYDFQYTSDFLQRFAKYAVHVCVFVATIYIWEAALMPMACNALNDIMQHAAARQKQLRNYVCMLAYAMLYFLIFLHLCMCACNIFCVCVCVVCVQLSRVHCAPFSIVISMEIIISIVAVLESNNKNNYNNNNSSSSWSYVEGRNNYANNTHTWTTVEALKNCVGMCPRLFVCMCVCRCTFAFPCSIHSA